MVSESAKCDTGKLHDLKINIHRLSREEKYRILIKEHDPNPSAYPRTRPYGSGAFRQFQPSWLTQYPWLHYSPHSDGVFCRACVLFAPETAGGRTLGQFVTKPFKSWVNKTQKMIAHGSSDYHLTAYAKMNQFMSTYENPSEAIDTRLDSQAQRQLEDNQQVIKSLFKVVMLLGKQGIALRGHRDDKIEWIEQTDTETSNQGNFIELIRFRADTDAVLRKHLESAPKNAQYTSKTIQNQLIDVVGTHIRTEMLQEIKTAKYYSIIADESSDISNKEQFSISFRYVFSDTVKEVFADFAEVDRITGKKLADTIVQSLTTWGLSLQNMRGQCYDGASNMAGARSGSSIIRQISPLAVYHHCAAID